MNRDKRPITLALAALGGQGGGVVTDWLISVARSEGYLAQATSVPGVAQRTGATIYYLEFFPRAALPADGRQPLLALMPHPGDVDIVVASELIEAGRVLQRGIVTPDRTTLIVSSHRDYTISEKSSLSDGRADAERITALAREHARRFVCFDMAAIAAAHSTMISSVILGSIAGAAGLPFAADSYRAAIRTSGIAVDANLAAFEHGRRHTEEAQTSRETAASPAHVAAAAHPSVVSLLGRIKREFPLQVHGVLSAGLHRLADYQDAAYADTFLERVAEVLALDHGPEFPLTEATARGLALWMSFEDPIRVAELKLRPDRSRRIRAEIPAQTGQIIHVTEFMKPRVEEICGTLPERLGRALLRSRLGRRALGRFARSRQVSTSRIGGFLMLYAVAALKRWRRATLRFHEEDERIAQWLTHIRSAAAADHGLAVEIAECQRLVKGYGDTYERGARNFASLTEAARRLLGERDSARKLRELRGAALADEDGVALRNALQNLFDSDPVVHAVASGR